jgi:hypothetical protein
MLAYDDIQHILLTSEPGLTGRYEFLSFCSPAGGRARLAAFLHAGEIGPCHRRHCIMRGVFDPGRLAATLFSRRDSH